MHTPSSVRIAFIVATLLPLCAAADDVRDKKRVQILEQMEALARETKIAFLEGKHEIKRVNKAVFRYDDQPRQLIDATVWTWTDNSRPIAFQKIEALDRGEGEWQFCLTSIAEQRLEAQWPSGRKFQTSQAGTIYRTVPASPAAATNSLERRKQLRELARSFTARIALDADGKNSQEMRLLTTPLYEYDDGKSTLLQGAVFGYSTNGTNPDLLIVLEARPSDAKTVWHYAPARMTTGGITVFHRQKAVWECEYDDGGKGAIQTWTYFQAPRQRTKEAQE